MIYFHNRRATAPVAERGFDNAHQELVPMSLGYKLGGRLSNTSSVQWAITNSEMALTLLKSNTGRRASGNWPGASVARPMISGSSGNSNGLPIAGRWISNLGIAAHL